VSLSVTWLGHSTFLFRTSGGKRVLIDPWLSSNPSCPEAFHRLDAADLILVTHGHDDHSADVVATARATGARVVAPYELSVWFQEKGLQNVTGMNPGGTLAAFDLAVTMVPAIHSSSVTDGGKPRYAGVATGYVVRFENGKTIYFAGDTSLFGDMRLIAELYRPTIAFLPIGDLFTMGPEQAAKACELLAVAQVVPMHYGTFPALTGTPAQLRQLVAGRGVEVLELKPGDARQIQ
jgi:L-ascorbate metabolism protein UlaG (beta-lactamase superfamily)